MYCQAPKNLVDFCQSDSDNTSDLPATISWSYHATSSVHTADGLSLWPACLCRIHCQRISDTWLWAETALGVYWRRFWLWRTSAMQRIRGSTTMCCINLLFTYLLTYLPMTTGTAAAVVSTTTSTISTEQITYERCSQWMCDSTSSEELNLQLQPRHIHW